MVMGISLEDRNMRRAVMVGQGMRMSRRPAKGATPGNRRSQEGCHDMTHQHHYER
jgi:hypothetical protein